MNNKLFAYNAGLKSRFQEVIFEDFDEAELSQSLGAKADGSQLGCTTSLVPSHFTVILFEGKEQGFG